MLHGLVMIIEDSTELLSLYGQVFTELGAQILLFSNASSALAYLAQGKVPDLVILDINMPRVNGSEFLVSVRSTPRLSELPIAVITGQTSFENAHLASKILPKLTNLTTLENLAKTYLRESVV